MKKGMLLLGIVLVGYALTGLVQVSPGERAVVRRFGRVLPRPLEPGLSLVLPLGMDRIDRVAVDRVQSVTIGYQDDGEQGVPAGQLLTGDHNLVNVQLSLFWKVKREAVTDYAIQSERVEGMLTRVAETVLGEWVASHTVDEALLNGKQEMPQHLVERTQERLEPYHLGVQVLDARVGLIAPPDEVKPAFDSVSRAQTNVATLLNKAEQESANRYRQAESEAYRLRQEASADAHGRVLLARQEAVSFTLRLRQYEDSRRSNPAYLQQIWQEERGKLFARLKESKQLGLLDHHLGPDGLDITIAPGGSGLPTAPPGSK